MKLMDDIYFEKGSEKYFFTIAEIEQTAKEAKEKNKQNRKLFRKIKHFMGSNETVMEIHSDLQKMYKLKTKTAKPLERSRIISDLLKRSRFCCIAADFKSIDFKDFYETLRKEYLKLCEDFVNLSFKNGDTIENWDPVKQALKVLQGIGWDIHSHNDKIGNMIILRKVLRDIEKTFSSLKYNYESSKLTQVKDEYSHISHLELKTEYKMFFNKMETMISDSFHKLIADLKMRIEKEEKQKAPSAAYLIKQMSTHKKIELDFEVFSSKYKIRVFDEKMDELKSFIDSLEDTCKIESNAMERIRKISDQVKRIIEMNCRSEEISSLMDRFILNYKEVVKEKEQLLKMQKEYQTQINRDYESLISPFDEKMNRSRGKLKEFPEWFSAYTQSKLILNKLKNVSLLEKRITDFRTEHYKSILNFLKSYHIKKVRFSEYINGLNELYSCYHKLGELEISSDLKEKIRSLKTLHNDFETEYNFALSSHETIKENLISNNFDVVEENYALLENFLKKYDKSELRKFTDINNKWHNLDSEFKPIKKLLTDHLEKFAYRGDLCLLEKLSNPRYVFITRDKIEFGRQANPGEFYTNGKVLIPWSTMSGNHGYIDLKTFIYHDNNSTNGSFSALSKTPKKQVKLKIDKDLNFARHVTFNFKFNNSFSYFMLSWIDRKNVKYLRFFDNPQDFLNIWAKRDLVFLKHLKSIQVFLIHSILL